MMAFLKARSKSKVSQKAPTKAAPKEAESPPMGSEMVQTMAEMKEAESSPKVSAKAQTKCLKGRKKGSLKVARTLTVSEKASKKEPMKAALISMGPGKTMAFLTASWKSMEIGKASTKAEPTEAGSLPMGSEKVQTMAKTKEVESPTKVSAKARA
jgi:hypothetical protein